jgi:aspartate 1-decarboxylase
MFRALMKSKIHRVAGANDGAHERGSCTIDENLLEAAGIAENEQVHIWNIASGKRVVTPAIKGDRGSGMVAVNGPAARGSAVGDVVIIAAFARREGSALNKPNLFLVHDVGLPCAFDESVSAQSRDPCDLCTNDLVAMVIQQLQCVLGVWALTLGYGACAALWLGLNRAADVCLTLALGVAGSMLLSSMGAVCAFLL